MPYALSPRIRWKERPRVFHQKRRANYEREGELTPALYERIGEHLNVDWRLIEAIGIIESAEKPFTELDYPVVRFEPHVWRKYRKNTPAGREFDKLANSTDLNTRWFNFVKMHQVDPIAAINAHSFGWGQIMGFNSFLCGYSQPAKFLHAMRSFDGQTKCIVNFIKNSPRVLESLRNKDLHGFSRHWNGPKYAKHGFHKKFKKILGKDYVWT